MYVNKMESVNVLKVGVVINVKLVSVINMLYSGEIYFTWQFLLDCSLVFLTLAMCYNKCLNGGNCTKPNTCSCRKGTSGKYCQFSKFLRNLLKGL